MYRLCTISLLSFFFPFSSAHNEKHFFYKNDYDANTSIKKKEKQSLTSRRGIALMDINGGSHK